MSTKCPACGSHVFTVEYRAIARLTFTEDGGRDEEHVDCEIRVRDDAIATCETCAHQTTVKELTDLNL